MQFNLSCNVTTFHELGKQLCSPIATYLLRWRPEQYLQCFNAKKMNREWKVQSTKSFAAKEHPEKKYMYRFPRLFFVKYRSKLFLGCAAVLDLGPWWWCARSDVWLARSSRKINKCTTHGFAETFRPFQLGLLYAWLIVHCFVIRLQNTSELNKSKRVSWGWKYFKKQQNALSWYGR